MSQLERQVEQLIARVRDLEAELARLRESDQGRRCFAELALAQLESTDSPAAPLGALSSDARPIYNANATVLETLIDGGLEKLKPIQNSAGANKLRINYWEPSLATVSAGDIFFTARLRDGRWYRLSGTGGPLVHVKVSAFGCAGSNATTGQLGGPATCRRYSVNPSTGELTDSGQDITVWNPGSTVNGNKWCVVGKNEFGMNVFVVERC